MVADVESSWLPIDSNNSELAGGRKGVANLGSRCPRVGKKRKEKSAMKGWTVVCSEEASAAPGAEL